MGTAISHYMSDPATTVDYRKGPSFDPLYGFPNGRKERVMIATEEEMDSAMLPLKHRDYCAHKLIEHMACRQRVWPLAYKCAHEKHDFLNCQYDDYVLRMKEHERERRLLERAKRKAAKAAREEELSD